MQGPVTTGVRTTYDCPDDMPIGCRLLGDRMQCNQETRRTGGVPSLGGLSPSVVRHYLQINALQEDHTKIGMFTLTQVRGLVPLIGVICVIHSQLLESYEAQDWLWIHSYIQPILSRTNELEERLENKYHTFQL
jgi:hypothetical protein